jgi:CHAD domain-containing protein
MSKAWLVPDIDPRDTVAVNASRIMAVRFDELLSHAAWTSDQEAVEQLHAARISAKRLRYTLEFFAPVYAGTSESALADLARLQEELGHVHDLDVRIEMIERELAKPELNANTPQIASGLQSLLKKQRAVRRRQYLEAQFAWNAIDLPKMREQLLATGATND